MRALILAAGQGERLWPLTEYEPKPLLPVANISLVERLIESLVYAGIKDIVVLVRFQAETMRRRLGDGRRLRCKITYVEQQKHQGTADAVRAAYQEFRQESRFLMVYGDNYYAKNAVKRFVAITNSKKISGMYMALAKVSDASQFGSVIVKNGRLSSIHEKPQAHNAGLINAGMYLLQESIFKAVENTPISERGEYELTDSLNQLIQEDHNVHAFMLREHEWIPVSYPWDLLEVNQQLVQNIKGVRTGSKVEAGVQIRGQVKIGPGTIVKSGSYIEGPVLIGNDCTIGPNSYLRPFSAIGDFVKIGASCEIKNSIVMNHTKIPHLSYIGDSIIGKNCNLGAGTITANIRFDEKPVRSMVKGTMVDSDRKKLGAVLGDNVETGINVSILPGVKVGPGSWIGPGVSVSRDLPNGSRQLTNK